MCVSFPQSTAPQSLRSAEQKGQFVHYVNPEGRMKAFFFSSAAAATAFHASIPGLLYVFGRRVGVSGG